MEVNHSVPTALANTAYVLLAAWNLSSFHPFKLHSCLSAVSVGVVCGN